MKSIYIHWGNDEDSITYFEKDPYFVVSMNRSDLPYLKQMDLADFPAIYVLIGDDKRYIGQTAGQNIYTRLSQHTSDSNKDWFDSVVFFSRSDGHLSKADTDYLERRLILDFKNQSNFKIVNSTEGNNGFISRESKSKADDLYQGVFDIINEVTNLDLFGTNLEVAKEEAKEKEAGAPSSKATAFIQYDGKKVEARSARAAYVELCRALLLDPAYKEKVEAMIVDGAPTSRYLFGRKMGRFSTSQRKNSTQLQEGVWLYSNFGIKAIKEKLKELEEELGFKVEKTSF